MRAAALTVLLDLYAWFTPFDNPAFMGQHSIWGQYDSGSQEIAARQVETMREALGENLLVLLCWTGRGVPATERALETGFLSLPDHPAIGAVYPIDAATNGFCPDQDGRTNFRDQRNIDIWLDDLRHLKARRWFSEADQPVIYFWTPAARNSRLAKVAAYQVFPRGVYLIAGENVTRFPGKTADAADRISAADAVAGYVAYRPGVLDRTYVRKYMRTQQAWIRFIQSVNPKCQYIPTSSFSANDGRIPGREGLHPPLIYTEDGARHMARENVALARRLKSPYIRVGTWNELGEGTAVEPTLELGYAPLMIIREALNAR